MTRDWQAEGMLDGLGSDARAGRVELLDRLHESGFSIEQLREAISEGRLALLPVESVLVGEPTYTASQAAELAGVDEPFLLELTDALGLPVPDTDDVLFGPDDVKAARSFGHFRRAGLPDDRLLELARMLGDAMVPLADGIRRLVGETLPRPDDTELDLGVRIERAALELRPLLSGLPDYALAIQLRELVRRDVVGGAEQASWPLAGAQTVAVAFADLVGFTRLGERVPGEELAKMSAHLSAAGRQVARPPVRFVKTIGDAVMLVSPQPSPLVGAMLSLVESVEADDELPSLRVGVAYGQAINRWGDWYGRPVNIASRITPRARPGSVLATKAVREATGEDYSWSRAGSRSFKNVSERISLHRAHRRGTRNRLGARE
ncbi:MAG TPA: adenylate cyclase regulatory domain-containing protein [Solirubrobacteraceae bacterium]|nr:adenylate cyclase regulatory domain-containing protein [Solirubrobacteraceae bacterium]